MSEVLVPGFLPSTSGLHFANRFPPGPTVRLGPIDPRVIGVGDASAGLCGGMCFTVRDLFEAGISVPPDREPPANGTPRFQSIVRRQVASLDWLRIPVRFWTRSALGGSFGGDRARATYEKEWPRIRREIDAGRLAMLGLIRVAGANPFKLTVNHQVIAYGYAEDGRGVGLHLYDPNWPDRDDVTATIRLDPAFRPIGLEQSTGEPLLGFFLAPFKPSERGPGGERRRSSRAPGGGLPHPSRTPGGDLQQPSRAPGGEGRCSRRPRASGHGAIVRNRTPAETTFFWPR